MAISIRFRRGTTAQNMAYTGPVGSITIDTELNTIRVHDGATAGGHLVNDAAAIQDLQDQIDALAIADISGLQTALDGKVNTSAVGAANGVAPLDSNSRIAAAYLPSYVDDVEEYANFAGLPGTGEAGKIYVTLDNNKVFRWTGSAYAEIVASPGSTDAVTEGSTNLYFTNARARSAISVSGDLSYDSGTGVISYTTPTYTKSDVGLGNVENYGIATQVEAEEATVNNKYMTPLRARNLLLAVGFTEPSAGNWVLDLGEMS